MLNDAQKVEIVERFMMTYESTLAESMKVLRKLEDLEFRQQLAESDPAKAKDLEGHTLAERQNKAKVMATGVAVADAIAFALGDGQKP